MGYRLLNQLSHASVKLTPAERLVAVMLTQDMADSSATGTPSVDYLAGVCDLSVRTVKRALLRLEEAGLLVRRFGAGRSVGRKQHRTTLYVWDEAVALQSALSDVEILRRGMATRTPSDQRRRYGCLVADMGDADTPSVLADERPDEGEGDEPSAPASAPEGAASGLFSVPSSVASPVEPAPAPDPEPAPEPESASSKGFPSHPEWGRYAAAFKALDKKIGRFSVQAWLRFVQQDGRSPEAIDSRASLAADHAEQYVKDLRRGRRGFETEKGYAKSAEAFLTEGEWEKHPPRPEAPQPAQGAPLTEDWGAAAGADVPEESFEERYSEYARAAAGDEGAIRRLRRMMPVRSFEAPDGVPARWPALIGLLGLREPFRAVPEDREAFARHAQAEGAAAAPEGGVGAPVDAPEEAPEADPGACEEGGVSWPVAPVGTPSEAYTEACAKPWEPHLAPPAPEPEASPDEPAAAGDDEWGIAEGERAARSARYSAMGSAEEFREQALLASQGPLWGEDD